jgi:hypothetical protein
MQQQRCWLPCISTPHSWIAKLWPPAAAQQLVGVGRARRAAAAAVAVGTLAMWPPGRKSIEKYVQVTLTPQQAVAVVAAVALASR